MIIDGDYIVTDKNREEAEKITHVEGGLTIDVANASLPALESVGYSLTIDAANASLPALESVGGMPWEQPTPKQARDRLRAVATAALANDDALYMGEYHICDTTHCIAGWAIHQAGSYGDALERAMGPCGAGLALLGIDKAPHFFTDNETARQWLAGFLEEAE